ANSLANNSASADNSLADSQVSDCSGGNQAIGIDRRTIQLEQTDIQCRAAEESLADHQLSRNNVSISRNRNITSVETGSSACVASVGGVVNSTRRETLGIHVNFDLLNSTHRRQGAAPIATALLGNPVT